MDGPMESWTHLTVSPKGLDRNARIQIGTYHDVILRDLRKRWKLTAFAWI